MKRTMHTNRPNTLLRSGAATAVILALLSLVVGLSESSTYEIGIAVLAFTGLGGLAISEFRTGASPRGNRVRLNRLPLQGFRV